jgi:hypothetical protein
MGQDCLAALPLDARDTLARLGCRPAFHVQTAILTNRCMTRHDNHSRMAWMFP